VPSTARLAVCAHDIPKLPAELLILHVPAQAVNWLSGTCQVHGVHDATAGLARPACPQGCLSFPSKAMSEGRSSNHTCEGELVLPPSCEVLFDHPVQ
jgi:hypothetical protein